MSVRRSSVRRPLGPPIVTGSCDPRSEGIRRRRLQVMLTLAQQSRGWTRRELARALGRDPSNLSNRSGLPKADVAWNLARVLDWSVAEVLDPLCAESVDVVREDADGAEIARCFADGRMVTASALLREWLRVGFSDVDDGVSATQFRLASASLHLDEARLAAALAATIGFTPTAGPPSSSAPDPNGTPVQAVGPLVDSGGLPGGPASDPPTGDSAGDSAGRRPGAIPAAARIVYALALHRLWSCGQCEATVVDAAFVRCSGRDVATVDSLLRSVGLPASGVGLIDAARASMRAVTSVTETMQALRDSSSALASAMLRASTIQRAHEDDDQTSRARARRSGCTEAGRTESAANPEPRCAADAASLDRLRLEVWRGALLVSRMVLRPADSAPFELPLAFDWAPEGALEGALDGPGADAERDHTVEIDSLAPGSSANTPERAVLDASTRRMLLQSVADLIAAIGTAAARLDDWVLRERWFTLEAARRKGHARWSGSVAPWVLDAKELDTVSGLLGRFSHVRAVAWPLLDIGASVRPSARSQPE